MILKKFVIKFIKIYQFFSPLFGNKCRFYPSCSNYALIEFENDSFFRALFKSILRILRCNQFFKGGVDFPIVKKSFNPSFKKIKVKYWYIPTKNKNYYFVIKVEDG